MASYGRPSRIASALDIMLEGPIGAAAFNNEFGRPNLAGYFRSYEQRVGQGQDSVVRGYHKPIMVAGGLGNISDSQSHKEPKFAPGTPQHTLAVRRIRAFEIAEHLIQLEL